MKMRLGGFLAFALLSVSIMSYGVNGSVFADSHNIPPLSVSVELPSYEYGNTVVLSGNIRDYDSESDSNPDITLLVFSGNNSPLTAGQFSPNSDGSFTYDFVAGGPNWKSGDTCTVKLTFGATTATTSFVYAGGDSSSMPSPAPPPPSPADRDGDGISDGADGCPTQPETVNGFEDADGCPDVAPPPPPPADRDGDGISDGADGCPTQPETVNGFEDADGCPDVAPPPPPPPPPTTDPTTPSDITCGEGTQLVDGVCQPIPPPQPTGGSCLIATAAYGTELAPQIQMLREVRDNTVLSTASGSAFMAGFNSLYYSFAPTVADWERENAVFKESVRAFITPMISTLSIMTLAQGGSEAEVLGLGISVIALNLGIYIAAPAFAAFRVHRHLKSRKRWQ